MPPWHIDKTVGIQKFKNDRSLSDEQVDTILRGSRRARRKATRRTCRAAQSWPMNRAGHLPRSTASRICSSSRRNTRCRRGAGRLVAAAVADGLTEPRWVRAIEIRPVGKNARKITHHALARLQQPEDMDRRSSPTIPTSRATACSWNGRSARTATRCGPIRGVSFSRGRASPGRCTTTRSARRCRSHGARGVVLPQGSGAETPGGARAVQYVLGRRIRRTRRSTSRRTGGDDGELRHAGEMRASRTSSRTCTCAARACRWKRCIPTANARRSAR